LVPNVRRRLRANEALERFPGAIWRREGAACAQRRLPATVERAGARTAPNGSLLVDNL